MVQPSKNVVAHIFSGKTISFAAVMSVDGSATKWSLASTDGITIFDMFGNKLDTIDEVRAEPAYLVIEGEQVDKLERLMSENSKLQINLRERNWYML